MTGQDDDKNTKRKVRSCLNCPSFLKASQVYTVFGNSTGMDHCARFGTILGMPGMNPRNTEGHRRATAENCTSFGLPRPVRANWDNVKPLISQPSSAAITIESRRETTSEYNLVEDCRSCVFYNRRGTETLGVDGAVCSLRMEYIFPGQEREKARTCGSSYAYSPYRNDRNRVSEDIRLIPELVDMYFKVLTPLDRWKANKKKFIDPSEYPTDREVTSEDKERGIRAWREVIDVDSGKSVYLPIYDSVRLPRELAKIVPQTGDDEHPENFIDYQNLTYLLGALWYELDETPTLWGFPGTGKTEILRHMAWLMQLPFHRISITASTELSELVGQFALRNNETVFVHGRLPRAWRSPGVICLDEPNVGPPEVWQAVRPLTDNSKQFVIDMNGGEIITRHPDSLLGLAMNPAWDTRNIGTEAIADADSSRLSHVAVDYPPAEIEREIMREWSADLDSGFSIEDKTLNAILSISETLRGLSASGSLSISWGVRHNIKVARASRLFNLETAYGIAAGNFLDPKQREVLLKAVRSQV